MDPLTRASEQAYGEMLGPHFIDLEEIIDVNEELQEEQDINEREELRRKLSAVKAKYRQERELHDHMIEHGLELEKLINETAAENKYLTGRVKEFQRQMANIRKMWEERDEETLRLMLLSEEEGTAKSQLIYIRKKEMEIQKLREKNKELIAEMARLSVKNKHREEIQNLEKATQQCKDLIQEQREEEGQEEQIMFDRAAAYLQNEPETLSEPTQPQGSSAVDDDDDESHEDERPLDTERRHPRVKTLRGVKVAGCITLCVLLSVGLTVHMVSDCISVNACDLLALCCDLCHTNSPEY